MPGFAETDPQKKITIDILQKCFLTRVPHSIFLVVADINSIDANKCATLMQHYHTPLSDMLGEQYVPSLAHLYFVLTKNNVHQYESVDVSNKLTDICLKILDENPKGARFLKRMAKRHVIVDLEQDDNNTLLNKITDMIQSDKTAQESTGRVAQWKIEKLAAGENNLNILCCRHVAKMEEERAKLANELDEIVADVKSKQSMLQQEIDKIRDTNHKALLRKKELDEALAKLQERVDGYEAKRASLVRRRKEVEEMIEVHKKQIAGFSKYFESSQFVQYRCDVSPDLKKSMVRAQGYKISLRADMNMVPNSAHLVLVMDAGAADEAIKSWIGNGTMIPDNLAQLENIHNESVLFNSKTQANLCKAKVSAEHGIMSITVEKWSKQFKVYIYSSRQFSEMTFFENFRETLVNDVEKDKKMISYLKGKIKELDGKRKEDKRKLLDLQDHVAQAGEAIEGIHADAANKVSVFEDTLSGVQMELTQLSDRIKACKEDKVLSQITAVAAIFRRNKIENSVSEPHDSLMQGFLPMESLLKETMRGVTRFVADRKELFELPTELEED